MVISIIFPCEFILEKWNQEWSDAGRNSGVLDTNKIKDHFICGKGNALNWIACVRETERVDFLDDTCLSFIGPNEYFLTSLRGSSLLVQVHPPTHLGN